MTEPTAQGKRLVQRHSALKAKRAPWLSMWRKWADYIAPNRASFLTGAPAADQVGNGPTRSGLAHESTAALANVTLARGQLAYATPLDQTWFNFRAPRSQGVDDDRLNEWYSKCAEAVAEALAESNFYTEIQEVFLDRGGFGTGALYCDFTDDSGLYFQAIPIGTYCIEENKLGLVDTIFVERVMTLRQIDQAFGRESLPKEWAEALEKQERLDEALSVVHAVMPRPDRERDPDNKESGKHMPFASIWFTDKGEVLREGGFNEMPYFVTRFLTWGADVWGYCPTFDVYPDIVQLNYLEEVLDLQSERLTVPPVLMKAGMEGEIDLRAGGVSYVGDLAQDAPREWALSARVDVGEARAEQKRERINQAFMVDLFRMFSLIDRQMTATEVGARQDEKLMQNTSSFTRLASEMLDGLLARVWAIELRQNTGRIPPPPEGAFPVSDSGLLEIETPRPEYTSRIGLAIKRQLNQGWRQTADDILGLAQVFPEVLKLFNPLKIAADISANNGNPADWRKTAAEAEEAIAAEAEAAAEAQKLAQMEQMAGAMGKAGSVKSDSLIGQALTQAMPQS